MTKIGQIIATEKVPSTVDEFYFWTDKKLVIRPFDVIKVDHINKSTTFGVVEEISHFTDSPSFLSGYISSDFGDVDFTPNTERIGMNCVKSKVIGNTLGIYTPVLNGKPVSLAKTDEIQDALGLKGIENPLTCGYLEMYEKPNSVRIPVHLNSRFLIGPEGAHLNISGISGLASKTSYAMFLLKNIQEIYQANKDESVAFIIVNVKGRDLLAIDEKNENEEELERDVYPIYDFLELGKETFRNVRYFYPYSKEITHTTYAAKDDVLSQVNQGKASFYKYIFEFDKDNIDLLFSNVDDPAQTMESIVNFIISEEGAFGKVRTWEGLLEEIKIQTERGDNPAKEKAIMISSWRKFYRLLKKTIDKTPIFSQGLKDNEVRLHDSIENIKANDVYVIDIAKLEEDSQGFVFGDVMRAVYDLKLGQLNRSDKDIPTKIIIFIDELNKYASKDVPNNSPLLKQLLDITERGRSLGIILFAAEQFKSEIRDRVKGNCSTHAYGRVNAIEVSKGDYQYIPPVFKSMMTRLKQGEYIVQNPVLRSLLNIKFPKPIYKQFKNG